MIAIVYPPSGTASAPCTCRSTTPEPCKAFWHVRADSAARNRHERRKAARERRSQPSRASGNPKPPST